MWKIDLWKCCKSAVWKSLPFDASHGCKFDLSAGKAVNCSPCKGLNKSTPPHYCRAGSCDWLIRLEDLSLDPAQYLSRGRRGPVTRSVRESVRNGWRACWPFALRSQALSRMVGWTRGLVIIIMDLCRVIVDKLGSLPGELLIVRNYRHRLLALSHQEGSTALHCTETLPDHDLVSFRTAIKQHCYSVHSANMHASISICM